MHTIDIIVLVVAVIFVGFGIRRGLIGEVFRLAAMVVGFAVAFLWYHDVAVHLRFLPGSGTLRNGVSFVLIYIGVAVAVLGIGWGFRKVVHLTPLGWIDRVLGGVIGLLKAALMAWVLCLSIASLPISSNRNSFNRSVVFKTYRSLPPMLSLPSLNGARRVFKRWVTSDARSAIGQTKAQVELLKEKVDSAKKAQDVEL